MRGSTSQITGPLTLSARPVRLLIIEDDGVHRMIIRKIAAGLEFDVVEAASYEDAIGEFEFERFDCITLDLALDTHTGIEILRHLWTTCCKIPILVISGADDVRRTEAMVEAEALHIEILRVVKKPLDLKTLKNALAKLKDDVVFRRTGL